MGRRAGFRYRDAVRKPTTFGWAFDRHRAGSHEIWRHPPAGRRVTLPHHARDMAEGTLRAVLREAAIDVDDFLKA